MAVALQAGEPGAHRRAGPADPAHPAGVGARRAHPATPLRHRLGLTERRRRARPPAVFGRFEAEHPNDLWTGDALHGPTIGGRKTYLFAFLDDHSRACMPGTGSGSPRTPCGWPPRCARRWPPAASPTAIYVDNGSAFVDAWLLRACAKLGVRLVHSTPGRPARPRQDRAVLPDRARAVPGRDHRRTRRSPAATTSTDLAELNRLFTAWVETVYHRRSTPRPGRPPLARWSAGGPVPLPDPGGAAPRRSCGRSTAASPRPRPCRCTATATRSTRRWSGARSSWCSTRST